ncbi:MAG: hypothetical protein HY926_04735 [Elusimicrobia bacterium]|nr:hypothetical protein [Elusimicrobiota bacterium]
MARLEPKRVALLLGLWAGAMLLYAGTLRHPPVWDDHEFVFGQDFLMDCRNLPRALSPASLLSVLPVRNCARPVWLASVLVDTCLGGGQVHAYRLGSSFWHAVGAVLVLALGWGLSGGLAAALAAGLLFAVHPVHAEAVNIITFRSDLLCLAFMLGSLLLYRDALRRAGWPRRAGQAGALAAFVLALLAKEMAVVLPLLLLLSHAYFPAPAPGRARPVRRRAALLAAAAFLALVPLYLVFRSPRSGYVSMSHQDVFSSWRQSVPAQKLEDPPWSEVYDDPSARFLTMSRVFGSYLRLLVWPWPLQGDYAPRVVRDWLDPGLLASWGAWLGLLAAAWALRRRLPLAGFGLAWTAVGLLPVSGLVLLRNLQAERYLYVSSAGFCLAVGAFWGELDRRLGGKRRWAGRAVLGLLLAVWAGRVWSRNSDFRSDQAFLEAAAAVDPGVPRVRLALARLHEGRGDWAAAEGEYRACLGLWPRARRARLQLADLLAGRGRREEALAQLRLAQELFPGDPEVLERLSRLVRRRAAGAPAKAKDV